MSVDLKLGNTEIKFWNYMHYSSDNYGVHSRALMIGNLTLFFSYNTVIGFQYDGEQYYCENTFSRTTGKHLSVLCPDKTKRMKQVAFQRLLDKALSDFKWFNLLEK